MRSFTVAVLFAAGCGVETPDVEASDTFDELEAVEQAVIPVATDAEFIDKSLMIIDPSVVDSSWAQSRLDNPAVNGKGAWTFAYLMANISGTLDSSAVAESLMVQLSTPQTVNGFPLQPLVTFTSSGPNGPVNAPGEALRRWCRTRDGRLDLTKAPFRLLAIVNRMDLRSSANEGGELRFIFNLLETDDSCASSEDDTNVLPAVMGASALNVIFELQQAVSSCSQARSVGSAWRALAGRPFGPDYNLALRSLTNRTLTRRDATRPNASQLNQLRTNEPESFTLWSLKELRLGGTSPTIGTTNPLLLVSPAATPHFDTVNDTPALATWFAQNRPALLAGTIGAVPASFMGSAFGGVESTTFVQRFRVGGLDANELTFQTCGGCHSTGAFGPHVGGRFGPVPLGREKGERTGLSTFMTGPLNPGESTPSGPGELARRVPLLKALPERATCSGVEVVDATPRNGTQAPERGLFSPGETLWVNVITSVPGTTAPANTVQLFRAGDPDSSPLTKLSLPRTSARVTLSLPAPDAFGTYELRVFTSKSAVAIAKSAPFTVAPNVHYTLGTSSFVQRGMPLPVSWSAPAGHSAGDRVSFFRIGAPDTTPLGMVAVGAGTPASTLEVNGTLNLTAPNVAGTYEVRMFRAGGTTAVATGQQVSVF